LAAGLTTLGLAGLMLGILPGTLSLGGATSSGSAPAEATSAPAVQAAPAPAASAAAGGAPEAQQSPNDLEQHFAGDRAAVELRPEGAGELERESNGGPVMIAGEPPSNAPLVVADDTTGASQLVVISGTLLIIGVGLFALRWASRRFGG
jgi:hypothetical protein